MNNTSGLYWLNSNIFYIQRQVFKCTCEDMYKTFPLYMKMCCKIVGLCKNRKSHTMSKKPTIQIKLPYLCF